MSTDSSNATRRHSVLSWAAENFSAFLHRETSGALALLVATIAALGIANSAFSPAYKAFWDAHAGIFAGIFQFDQSIKHWVDDALMALFFFVVGLEIKREFIVGELSTWRGAALPVFAAFGGMIAPAVVYLAFNLDGPGANGWGVPMATDIAFSLGVLALLGSRAPQGLKVFLAALAIVDDIGTVLVIALFYTAQISAQWLLAALIPLAFLVLMNRSGIYEPLWYLGVASVMWFCVLNSGVHATIAGVIAAFAIPAKAKITPTAFTNLSRIKIEEIDQMDVPGAHTLQDDRQQRKALEIRTAALRSTAPLQRLEFGLHPVTAFVVLPLFALANANIRIVGSDGLAIHEVGLGVFFGLVAGKPLGIALASWIAVQTGLANLPHSVTWRHVVGAGMLGGIGFTMSLFMANLTFRIAGVENEAKTMVLVASMIAGTLGYCWLRFVAPAPDSSGS
ncbi:MAG: Na+/H+ antiporter NhaA [Pseudomonadota bacterium]